ncbi:MAG: ATP-grasp domain-containing protein [Clostridia bacterium]|nr:ATP-grasp domain-containing protein [Clostridia bacterium]
MKAILFPSDYFNINKADTNYSGEYEAVKENNSFDVFLFSYDDFIQDGKIRLNKKSEQPVSAIYRGWMMKPNVYADFYYKLQSKNIYLITKPEEYEKMHSFPNIYPELKDDTAKMIVYDNPDEIDYSEIKKHFSRFMIKDYVKSVKGTDFPKCISTDISEDTFRQLIAKFLEYRGSLYTGGICIKEFLDLKKYGDKTNEYRVFYMNNNVATVSRNSGQPVYAPEPPKNLIEKYKCLSSPFYTVDYAQLKDDSWKIIEAGDGQVSGLSDFQDTRAFYRLLNILFDENEQEDIYG